MYLSPLHFESKLARDCKYLSTTVKFEIGMEIFTTTGHSLLSPGYTSILTWQALGSSDTLPKFTPDEQVNVQEVKKRLYSYYILIYFFFFFGACVYGAISLAIPFLKRKNMQ